MLIVIIIITIIIIIIIIIINTKLLYPSTWISINVTFF